MHDKSKFAIYVFAIIIATALLLRLVNYYTKTGRVEINQKTFRVEIVKNEWDMKRGLSGKASIKNDEGMLFIFPKADYQIFWMKGMRFLIDIIWINEGKIVDIRARTPIPVTKFIESYRPSEVAKYVLEINAGLAEKYGFKIGDAVKLDI